MKRLPAVLTALSVFLTIISISNAQFLWGDYGVPVRSEYETGWDRSVLTNQAGETYVVWDDCREGFRSAWAQKYSLAGQALWEEGGINIGGTMINPETGLAVDLSGDGGFIACWGQASEAGGIDLIVQRIDNDGNILWGTEGVLVYNDPEWITGLDIVHDGESGAIVLWSIFNWSSELEFIYALRLDSDGNIPPGWDPGGVLIRGEPTDGITLIDMEACSDDAGGIIALWNDVGSGSDVYAQRVSGSGELLWGTGVPVCQHAYNQEQVRIIPDGENGAFCAWTDENYGNGSKVLVQKIDSDGNPLWELNGVMVCYMDNEQEEARLSADGEGGVIAAFEGGGDIYSQRIDTDGNLLWGTTGVTVCSQAYSQVDVDIAGDGTGGTFLAWRDHRNTAGSWMSEVFAQYLDGEGQAYWQYSGILLRDVGYYPYPAVNYLSDGGAMFAWHDRPDMEDGIYIQKADAAGNLLLGANGEAVTEVLGGGCYNLKLVRLSTDQVLVVYGDSRDCSCSRLYYQIFDFNGNAILAENGIPLTPVDHDFEQHSVTATSDGGAVIVWVDDQGSDEKVFAQKVDHDGNILWHPDGIEMTSWDDLQMLPQVCSDGAGGAYIGFHSYNGLSCTDSDIYIQRIAADGSLPWGSMARTVTYAATSKHLYGIAEDGAGGAILTWTWELSWPPQNYDIYAARYTSDGDSAWVRIISDLPCDQRHSSIISSRDGGAVIAWEDARFGQNHMDIFAQKIDNEGNFIWVEDGMPVRVFEDESSEHVKMVEDDDGYTYYVFEDGRGIGYRSLWCMRLTPDGRQMFHDQGMVVSTHSCYHTIYNIAGDGEGGVIVVWDDDDQGQYNRDIYVTHMNTEGLPASPVWQPEGNPVGGGFGYRNWSNAISDGEGGVFITWSGSAPLFPTTVSPTYDAYLSIQRMNENVISIEPLEISGIPAEFELHPPYPNPFNHRSMVSFSLARGGMVRLKVFDVTGREVRVLHATPLQAGYHEVVWDAGDSASGVYFVRLEAGQNQQVKKMLLVK